MKRTERKGRRIALLIVCAALALSAAACFAAGALLGRTLSSQRAAERWRGESGLDFCQISCFVPVDETLGQEKIYQFRTDLLKRLHEAALDVDNEETLFVDDGPRNVETAAAMGMHTLCPLNNEDWIPALEALLK